MAFDTPTRNRLNQFVGDARALLTEKFTEQCQVEFGMNPETGEVTELERLSHLDDAQRQTAIILRETLSHYYANLPTKQKDQAKDYQSLIERIVREQAFTILNRLCAIRMAEARDLVIESIGAGVQSKGFQLYQHVCGNSLGETGAAYQQYLLSLFDEFGVDLPVLFDRYSPQGRLFPRETVLTELIGMINDPEINRLWAEDETIGWIYQYFNSKEERKAMRDASQAPRNSRELAVRNQFFTPRYVVEFLTDNTLGRIWYEMRKGETGLKETCQYLVRRPNENFLAEGKEAPETEQDDQEKDLTQEELLNQPVHIPHRPLKDPREIRMLDPACGSMHFGLYAFDLYLKIFEEFWDLITANPDTAVLPSALSPLPSAYSDKAEFMKAVPRLIIEHNIHGIDIDPRAVQIAGLSLWLRAQRAWKSQGIAAGDRPQVTRSNVVCAEPMPGDQQQLEAFCKELHPAIAQMVTAIFEEMKLAGEAGSLLKIEQEISSLVAAAKKQFQDNPPDQKIQQQFFGGASVVKEQQMEFDLSGITDELFFEKAEEEIYSALQKYASESSEGGFRRKLFANDAEKGFAFIELCRKLFDVTLMNPPFGEYAKSFKKIASSQYLSGGHDILTAFVQRTHCLLKPRGFVGAITSRTVFFAPTTREWREELVLKNQLNTWFDLGEGVLDDAMVETCMYTIEKNTSNRDSLFVENFELVTALEKFPSFQESRPSETSINGCYWRDCSKFRALPGAPLSYWVGEEILNSFARFPSLEEVGVDVKVGQQTGDDFRFVRCWWEVPATASARWVPHAKGGENLPFATDIHLVINWENDAAEIRSHKSSTLRNTERIGASGLTFPYRTYRFSPAIMPQGVITGVAGMGVYSDSSDLFFLSAVLNSSFVNEFIKTRLQRRSLDSLYQAGCISPSPFADFTSTQVSELSQLGQDLAASAINVLSRTETTQFCSPPALAIHDDLECVIQAFSDENQELNQTMLELFAKVDCAVADAYGFEETEIAPITKEGKATFARSLPGNSSSYRLGIEPIVGWIVGGSFGRYRREFFQSPAPNLPNALDEIALAKPAIPNENGFEILVDDPISESDIVGIVSDTLKSIWPSNVDEIEAQICRLIDHKSLRSYFSKDTGFFEDHLTAYSKSRRSAPIYWPISTESGSYTLWLYYHRLTDQTLYKAVNDFVDPKLKQAVRQLGDLRAIKDRSSAQEKELAQLTELESELEQFKADLLEIAAFWKPNLNDGVQITAAPLHKFFRLKKWRDKLAKTWKELQDGKYDWGHLALSIWPDRVVREKCTTDRSIAIAHDLEEQLWHEVEVTKVSKSGRERTKIEWQPRQLTESQLDEIIEKVKSN